MGIPLSLPPSATVQCVIQTPFGEVPTKVPNPPRKNQVGTNCKKIYRPLIRVRHELDRRRLKIDNEINIKYWYMGRAAWSVPRPSKLSYFPLN